MGVISVTICNFLLLISVHMNFIFHTVYTLLSLHFLDILITTMNEELGINVSAVTDGF